jgi:hypothetical protein
MPSGPLREVRPGGLIGHFEPQEEIGVGSSPLWERAVSVLSVNQDQESVLPPSPHLW